MVDERRHIAGRDEPRILLLSPSISPPHGGLQRFSEDLNAVLNDALTVHLIAVARSARADVQNADIIVGAKGRPAEAMTRIAFARRIRSAIATRGFDIVHAVTWRAATAAVIGRRDSPPIVVHCHGSELLRVGPVSKHWRDLVLRKADALIAVSSRTAQLVYELVGKEAVVIPNGLRDGKVKPSTAPRTGAFKVLSVGRLVPRKGHLDLITAVRLARSMGCDIELTIVGSGPQRAELEAQVRLSGESWISMPGEISQLQLERAYAEADVFALLGQDAGNDYEGFGIVYLEAASWGLPIVARAETGVLDSVDPGRNSAIVRTVGEAATELVALSRDPERRKWMSLNGLQFVEGFRWATLLPRLLAVYYSLQERQQN